MKKLLFLLIILTLTSCKKDDEIKEYGVLHWQVTLLLPDNGLGDEGLFDHSFEGVMNFKNKVGTSAVDMVINIPYDSGDSNTYLRQWITEGASTTVNHRLLFCPMPSEEQCDILASANISDGDEVLIICGNGTIANRLQSLNTIMNDSRFHIYILDSRSAGEQVGKTLAAKYISSQSQTDSRRCAAILTTTKGQAQNSDLIEGFKEGVKSTTGQETFIKVTDENRDSTFRIATELSKEYACILPATYYSNYGIYCALMNRTQFHTVKLDGVVPPVSTLENISIDRDIKSLAYSLLTEWRNGKTLEHIKTTTIPCEQ